ncbi:tail protein [Xenorhabdus vietnamensis]|uniref:Tail protein n=1 Tax=Xenorhabdus vietnamensis TaxID=351656 RepID=A0A1Y2S618_9GAMM|nr:phage tail protein [Xenorhabdus vietnamensis]OTA14078.1 tail protein [Xenorhabdus vietnamensis]
MSNECNKSDVPVCAESDGFIVVPSPCYIKNSIKESMKEHAQSRDHPEATLREKGFVILSNSVNNDDETYAATSKAVKTAYDLANIANQNAANANNNANARLAKDQNGADIPEKAEFVKNIGAQPAGNYAIKGDSYTKSESDARYGSKNTAEKSVNGWWQCGDTGVIHQWVQGEQQLSEGTQIITFPRIFPNQVLAIYVSTKINHPTNLNLANDWFQVINWDTEKCWVYLQETEPAASVVNSTPFIFAVGY